MSAVAVGVGLSFTDALTNRSPAQGERRSYEMWRDCHGYSAHRRRV
jgi:hypothetical protein